MIPNETWNLAFMNLDGKVIGTVHIAGSGAGPPPPGAPKDITAASWMVTGGSGAFFGVLGYFQAAQDSVSPERRTTDCEDPAYRRVNADAGGNKRQSRPVPDSGGAATDSLHSQWTRSRPLERQQPGDGC
jgi:hypothetical protein